MTIDTPTLIAQIDQLARAIDDTTCAELEAALEHAFSDDVGDMGRVGDGLLSGDQEYREGFLAGMVLAVVLARRGSSRVRELVGLDASSVVNHAADIWEKDYGEDIEGVAQALRVHADRIDDGTYPQ